MLPLSISAKQLLALTSRPQVQLVSMKLDGLDPLVHAVEVDTSSALALWNEMLPLLQGTGYYPLVTCFFGNPQSSWRTTIHTDLPQAASRFFFNEEVAQRLPGMQSSAPASVLKAAALVDYRAASLAYLSQIRVTSSDIDWEIERLNRTYGRSPSRDELELALLNPKEPPTVSYQRAVFNWQRLSGLRPERQEAVPWYEPREPMALLLLPIEHPEHALAHLHWWGSSGVGTPTTIATLTRWRSEFATKLACHFGTMLQFYIEHPPRDLDRAFELAIEIEALAPTGCLSDTAWHVSEVNRWFIHSRP